MPISGRQTIKILEKHGFKVVRQKGSHVVLAKEVSGRKLISVVPVHREMKKGTLRSIATMTGIEKAEFGL